MSDIKVTVVTACYNSAETIEKTIKSVLNQISSPYEHIFVDGASSDSTVETIEKYKDLYKEKGIALKLICEPDKGVYDAMNKGIHASSGDIIGLLNSDDYYEPNAVKLLKDAVKQDLTVKNMGETLRRTDKHDSCGQTSDIYMGAIIIHNGPQLIRKRAKFSRIYQTSRHFNHPAMFATRKTYDEVGDYLTGNVHNDYEWFLRALKMGKSVHIIPEVMTDFVIGGVSSKKSFSNTLKRIRLKYEVYSINRYSKLYFLECVGQELAKYVLMKRV